MVRLQIWVVSNTPSLPLLSGPLWPGVVVAVSVTSMGQIVLIIICIQLDHVQKKKEKKKGNLKQLL